MKRCLVVANSLKERASSLADEISAFLGEKGLSCESFFYDGGSDSARENCVDFSPFDFAVTLGGDGTVLFACRSCAPLEIPVFPINLGDFGFLASVDPCEWRECLAQFLEGKAFVSERILVEAEVLRSGGTVFSCESLNDCVISSSPTSKLVNLNVAYNRALLGPFKANGIIVSTPTGSTAYSAAAGGPIVEPAMGALVLTPVSSFSLSARPLVFGGKGEIAITVMKSRCQAVLSCDGQLDFDLEEGDVIILGISRHRARLVCSTQEKFYAALQSKLNWAGGPRA